MKAVVLIPFRGDGGPRDRNLQLTLPQYTGLRIVIASDGRDPFASAHAVNRAAEDAGEWDVAFVNDADIIVPRKQVAQAIERAHETCGYVLAQSLMHYVSDVGVREILSGVHPRDAQQDFEPVGRTGEKPYAIHRSLWDEIGGYDVRFDGYAGDGIALSAAATCLGTATRVDGPCWHLAHPPHDRNSDPAFQQHCELANRYSKAVRSQKQMRALIAEQFTS